MADKPDDLEAVRTVVKTLEPFDSDNQERIIRWAREKLGLSVPVVPPPKAPPSLPRSSGLPDPAGMGPDLRDIKTFVSHKRPTNINEFTATVAYYYRFEAPDVSRKGSITADDLQETCRLVGRKRLSRPSQTLINAHAAGLLDKTEDRGAYTISTVGENLVAMTLPATAVAPGSNRRPRKEKPRKPVRRSANRRTKKG